MVVNGKKIIAVVKVMDFNDTYDDDDLLLLLLFIFHQNSVIWGLIFRERK